jgi:hypothetical protein
MPAHQVGEPRPRRQALQAQVAHAHNREDRRKATARRQ